MPGSMPFQTVLLNPGKGAHARPMHPQWARDACRQLTEAGVPVWFKRLCTISDRHMAWVTPNVSSMGHPEHKGEAKGGRQDQGAEPDGLAPTPQGFPARLGRFDDHPVRPAHGSSWCAAHFALSHLVVGGHRACGGPEVARGRPQQVPCGVVALGEAKVLGRPETRRPRLIWLARDARDSASDGQWGGRTLKAGGRELDGRTWDQVAELAPVAPMPLLGR
jgi:hypothetical protein